MADQPDPRLDVLLPLFDWRRGFAVSVLNSLDAVDPKRRLLDTLDALDPADPGHEALARAIVHKPGVFPPWAQSETEVSLVCAVIAALREEMT